MSQIIRANLTILAIAVLAGSSASGAIADSSGSASRNPGIVVGESIDGVYLGETITSVEHQLGQPSVAKGNLLHTNGAEAVWYHRPIGTVEVANGRVVSVNTSSPAERTSSGAFANPAKEGSGTPLATLHRLYSHLRCSTGAGEHGETWDCAVRSRFHGQGVQTTFTGYKGHGTMLIEVFDDNAPGHIASATK